MRLYLGALALAIAACSSTASEGTKADGDECHSDGDCRSHGCRSPYYASGVGFGVSTPPDAGVGACGHAGEPACVCAGPSCERDSDCAMGWACKSGGVFNPNWCVPTCGHCPVGLVCDADAKFCTPG